MIPAHEQRLRAERDAAVAEAAELRAKLDRMSRDYTEVAQAVGMAYEFDYREPFPAPHDEVVSNARKCYEAAMVADDWKASAKNLADQIDKAVTGFHAAGILTFGTLAQGVEKLAGERDAAKAMDPEPDSLSLVVTTFGKSGVQIQHLPTLTVVMCDEHGTHKRNREGAMAKLRAALFGKTMFCAKCEETERALETFSKWVGPNETVMREGMQRFGLWRDPAPARADESGGGR